MFFIELGPRTLEFIIDNFSMSWLSILISSFCGAFFAFLFVEFSKWIQRIRKRKKINYNTLVQLDHIGNENLSILYDNIFVVNDMIITIDNSIKDKEAKINFNTFEDVIINREALVGLSDIEFLNQCFVFNVHSRKINNSLLSLKKFYSQINSFFKNKGDIVTYLENLKIFKQHLETISLYLNNMIEEQKVLLATLRVLKKNSNVKKEKRSNLIDSEIEILNKELEQSLRESKKRIENLQKK